MNMQSKSKLLAVVATFLSLAGTAHAGPKFKTQWLFKATYQSGESYESTDPLDEERLIPWTGSLWSCKRDAVSYNAKKNMVAGFTCTHRKGGFVTVLAACPATKESTDTGNAGVGDETGWFSFVVICATTATTPAESEATKF